MQKKTWTGPLILVLIAAITYLPLILKIGYLNDDWYLMFDGHVGGASFFHTVYSVDRPLRGYLMQMAFSLFGMNVFYYHLSAFLFRVLSAVGLLWLCSQLWPKRSAGNLLAAILFLIYPGFLSQVNPIDYQSQIFSLACGMFSVALTVKAVQSVKPVERWAYTILSVLLGWLYLGLVEYFIGFEALRLIAVGVLFWRSHENPISARLSSTLYAWSPFLMSAGGFLIWRLFFFHAERKATDIGVQLSSLFTSPLTGLWWLNYLIQDIFKVVVAAWAVPLNAFAFSLRLRDTLQGFGLMILAVLIMSFVFRTSADTAEGVPPDDNELSERLWVAITIILAGLLPVILVNRHVILPDYSRYTLAASGGVSILLATLIGQISKSSWRVTVASVFVAIAVLTHYGNSTRVVNETAATREFWWQVAWRAPQIKQGVTLIASYPDSALSEDYFVWGPANFIYYPEKQANNPILIKLPSSVLTSDAVLNITTKGSLEIPLRRGNYLERDFGNVLVMIQTSPNGCVRFINGESPELSPYDEQRLFLAAPYSRLDSVISDAEYHSPPTVVFGEEPAHGWCYYYQKADLARQRGEWAQIPILLQTALDNGYYPEDGLEWMPFLQASAILGDVEQVRSAAKLIAADKFLRIQTCKSMTDLMQKESMTEDVKAVIVKNICK